MNKPDLARYRLLMLSLTGLVLMCCCLGLSGCPKDKEALDLERPRAEAIRASDMTQEQQQQILAGAAMRLPTHGHLRFARPDLLMEVIRPPFGIEERDFSYSLFFDDYEGVYWISEMLPDAHAPRWYGPLLPMNKTIEALTPADYVPPTPDSKS